MLPTPTKQLVHPAPFNVDALKLARRLLNDRYDEHDPNVSILDPMAGIGRVHDLPWPTVGVELEPEWAATHPDTQVGDATHLACGGNTFDAIVTSPPYGNRLADQYAGDGTKRLTYRISLGRPLTDGSAAAQQWGRSYRRIMSDVWAECARVLKPNGLMIVNLKDHVRKGKVMPVTGWTANEITQWGLRLVHCLPVPSGSTSRWTNSNEVLSGEVLLVFDGSAEPFDA